MLPSSNPGSNIADLSVNVGVLNVHLVCYPIASIPAAVLGIILGAIGRRKAAAGTAKARARGTAGIVFGIVAIILVAVAYWVLEWPAISEFVQ